MLKRDELQSRASCLNKALPDEPVFVLRANDPMAPQAVRLWAAMSDGYHESDKIGEALTLADQMDEWRDHRAKVPPSPVAPSPVAPGMLDCRRRWPDIV